jgi:hypothetical protein
MSKRMVNMDSDDNVNNLENRESLEQEAKSKEQQGVTGQVPSAVTPQLIEEYKNRLREKQSLMKGILGGIIGAVTGAVTWAFITALTKYQIGYMSIGLGFLTGFGVRLLGRGVDIVFGIVGAIISLVGCLVGNLLAVIIVVAMEYHVPFYDVLATLTIELIGDALADFFGPLDLLFYGLALFFGYRFSIITVKHEDVLKYKKARDGGIEMA